jgi:hypothetical protein
VLDELAPDPTEPVAPVYVTVPLLALFAGYELPCAPRVFSHSPRFRSRPEFRWIITLIQRTCVNRYGTASFLLHRPGEKRHCDELIHPAPFDNRSKVLRRASRCAPVKRASPASKTSSCAS